MKNEVVKYFSQRMLPVALVVGLGISLVPPFLYALVQQRQAIGRADTLTAEIAVLISDTAKAEPYFWRYNLGKLVGDVLEESPLESVSAISVETCAGEVLHDFGEPADDNWVEHPIVTGDSAIGYVRGAPAPAESPLATRAVAAGSTVIGVLVAGFLFWFPRRVVRGQAEDLTLTTERLIDAEGQLRRSNEELQARVEAGIEEARRLSRRLVDIQESERARIARDLHDGVGQLVTALQVDLERLRQRPHADQESLGGLTAVTEETIRELRRVVRDLKPTSLLQSGLVATIREVAEQHELRTAIPVSFRHSGTDIDDEQLAMNLLRVVQESLTNATRHADASEIAIRLEVTPETTRLEIEDDGRGFDVEAIERGLGLSSIEDRVRFYGGQVEFTSRPGDGTRVLVTLGHVQNTGAK